MQVESLVMARTRCASFVFMSGLILVPLVACHPAPAPGVVATVNGKEILRSDLDRKYQIYRMNLGNAPQTPSADEADMLRLETLRQMIDDEILQQRAAKLNVVASDEDVNARLTEMKAPFTQEEWDKQLKDRSETLDDLKKDIRHDLTQSKLLNKEIESRINITDSEISAFYAAHKSDFNLIEPQYRIAWIVATGAPAQQTGNLQNNKAASDTDAKKKMQLLHAKLESGEDFGAVAMQYSEDPGTASSGGDRGFVRESDLRSNPEVYDAISKLKPGQYTDVLSVPDGSIPGHHVIEYAIFRLIGREPAGQRELNDVKVQGTIRQGLRNGHAQLLKSAYIEKLRDEAKVNNYLADQILKEGAH